jgi:uncharacterized protein YbcI
LEATHQDRSKSPQACISSGSVRIVRRHTGRGPTKARTVISDEMVTILMSDTLTAGERNLVGAGAHEQVLELRYKFQQIMGNELIALVEEHVPRKVVAFMSTNHTDPDFAVEVFVLAPAEVR